jgi:hypothetical protein
VKNPSPFCTNFFKHEIADAFFSYKHCLSVLHIKKIIDNIAKRFLIHILTQTQDCLVGKQKSKRNLVGESLYV